MGPISTGLGEIAMWTVRFLPGERRGALLGQTRLAGGRQLPDPRGPAPPHRSGTDRLSPHGAGLDRAAQIRTVPGVAGVDSIGGFEKQYHVQPDPNRLAALDLSFGDVAKALETNNANQGARYLEDRGEGYVVRAAGRLAGLKEIADVVVAARGGVPVRIATSRRCASAGTCAPGPAARTGRRW